MTEIQRSTNRGVRSREQGWLALGQRMASGAWRHFSSLLYRSITSQRLISMNQSPVSLRSVLVALCLSVCAALAFAVGESELIYQSVYSVALKDNLLGDPSYRSVIVYLPPSYHESDRRYPSIYLLHGYDDTNTIWRDGFFQGFNVQTVMDRLIEEGEIREMILVMPDGRNAYGGSYYINSPVTGRWGDFITRDLVAFIDETYRTLPSSDSRGIAGHSMGGYGAIFLAARHPDVFSAVYGLSACCLSMEGDVTAGNQEWIPTLRLKKRKELVGAGMYPNAFVSVAAAMSPDPGNEPFLVDFPFKLAGDSVVRDEEGYEGWVEHFPAESIDDFARGFARLRAIGFDVGDSDPITHITLGSLTLSRALMARDIEHSYEQYQGDHTNRIGERLEKKVLPLFSATLVSDDSD